MTFYVSTASRIHFSSNNKRWNVRILENMAKKKRLGIAPSSSLELDSSRISLIFTVSHAVGIPSTADRYLARRKRRRPAKSTLMNLTCSVLSLEREKGRERGTRGSTSRNFTIPSTGIYIKQLFPYFYSLSHG